MCRDEIIAACIFGIVGIPCVIIIIREVIRYHWK